MTLRLLNSLLNPKRVPNYLNAIIYAGIKGILTYKMKFKGMLSLPEGVLLHKLTSSLKDNSMIVEIGCYGGLSTIYLLSGLNKKSVIYSIDPFNIDIESQEEIILGGEDKDYNRHELNILINKPSKKDVETLLKKEGFINFKLFQGYSFDLIKKWDKKIDILWIDGNHDYKKVEKDFLQWTPFIIKGGIIAFHDANKKDDSLFWNMGWDGPTRVVNKYIKIPKWINLRKVDSIAYAIKNFN